MQTNNGLHGDLTGLVALGDRVRYRPANKQNHKKDEAYIRGVVAAVTKHLIVLDVAGRRYCVAKFIVTGEDFYIEREVQYAS